MTKFQYQKLHGDSIFKQAYEVLWEKVGCEWNSWSDKGEIADETKQNVDKWEQAKEEWLNRKCAEIEGKKNCTKK